MIIYFPQLSLLFSTLNRLFFHGSFFFFYLSPLPLPLSFWRERERCPGSRISLIVHLFSFHVTAPYFLYLDQVSSFTFPPLNKVRCISNASKGCQVTYTQVQVHSCSVMNSVTFEPIFSLFGLNLTTSEQLDCRRTPSLPVSPLQSLEFFFLK